MQREHKQSYEIDSGVSVRKGACIALDIKTSPKVPHVERLREGPADSALFLTMNLSGSSSSPGS